MKRRHLPTPAAALIIAALVGAYAAPADAATRTFIDSAALTCCEYESVPGLVYVGARNELSFQEIASYAAPVLWFSPDEPLLGGRSGPNITIPTFFPFEDSVSTPVAYYRVRTILVRPDADSGAVRVDRSDRPRSQVRIDQIVGMDIDYFFYYPSEVGFGGHKNDVESVEIKLTFGRRPDCEPDCRYAVVVKNVVGKAHGMLWYDNTLAPSVETRFPIHILVEEGKHASCPDANGDGQYTPGYDVTERVNDAWGVRDIIRGGTLYSGGFQSWMAKTRQRQDRVFPPLPADSRVREQLEKRADPGGHAVYELRPFPSAGKAAPDLVRFIADKGDPNWPLVEEISTMTDLRSWVSAESFIKSTSIAYRYDGEGRGGVALTLPLLIVRPFNEPMGGGWIGNRLYLKDYHLRDIGWQLQYTSSASRWVDPYFSAGAEWDKRDDGGVVTYGVVEQGVKFRVNVVHSPLKFMSKLTDFWGLRFGLKARGLAPVSDWNYVIELGSGTF
jgi:hypothetical protein